MENEQNNNPASTEQASNSTYDVSDEASEALKRFEAEQRINAALPSYAQPVTIQLRFESIERHAEFILDSEAILGRQDALADDHVDIDLTQYGGYQLGVSRKHASFRRDNRGYIRLVDLSSRNGTFINGKKLDAYVPAPIVDGDLIRLGKLVARVHVEPDA